MTEETRLSAEEEAEEAGVAQQARLLFHVVLHVMLHVMSHIMSPPADAFSSFMLFYILYHILCHTSSRHLQARSTDSAIWRLLDGPGEPLDSALASRSAQGRLDFVLQAGAPSYYGF